ncbi:MAG: DUF2141 domain-containing protein [Bacteroidia bacterium]|nr:MAG: DUF2141 domain-containing protein [Bacteroidia bacterium]
MKQVILYTLLLCACQSYSLFAQSNKTGTLEIRFTGIRTEEGSMAVGINTSPEGWPKKAQIQLQLPKENMKDSVFVVRIPDLPFGTLAISVLDDVNDNVKMDQTLGIPKEGFGFSNNASIRFLAPPKYESCTFEFTGSMQQISIKLEYWGKDK